jgi:hypothetical protein
MPKRKLEHELSEVCKMEAGVVGGVNDRAKWIHTVLITKGSHF